MGLQSSTHEVLTVPVCLVPSPRHTKSFNKYSTVLIYWVHGCMFQYCSILLLLKIFYKENLKKIWRKIWEWDYLNREHRQQEPVFRLPSTVSLGSLLGLWASRLLTCALWSTARRMGALSSWNLYQKDHKRLYCLFSFPNFSHPVHD